MSLVNYIDSLKFTVFYLLHEEVGFLTPKVKLRKLNYHRLNKRKAEAIRSGFRKIN